jgi:hypothetical protein
LLSPGEGDRVELVDEEDARGACACLLEGVVEVLLAASDEGVEDVFDSDVEERESALARRGAGEQSLAAAGRVSASAISAFERPWATSSSTSRSRAVSSARRGEPGASTDDRADALVGGIERVRVAANATTGGRPTVRAEIRVRSRSPAR